VVASSALPAMLSGDLRGEAGSCLAACVAVVARPGGCDDCAEDERCLETSFGPVCHAPGPLASGEACRGDQDCASLRCAPEEARCE
jgi:hypothetical protein